MTTPATGWQRCACGTLTSDAHVAAMIFPHCPACGSRQLSPATTRQAHLADAGAVRITTYARNRSTT